MSPKSALSALHHTLLSLGNDLGCINPCWPDCPQLKLYRPSIQLARAAKYAHGISGYKIWHECSWGGL